MTTDNSQKKSSLKAETLGIIQDEKEFLRNVNYAVHESGHICAAASRNLPVSAEIGVSIPTELGRLGAITWHVGGTSEDDLFILACGIATSRRFGLGEAGLLRDVRDIDSIAADLPDPESAKNRAGHEAELFIKDNATIIKMAYALFQTGRLDEDSIWQIYLGTTNIIVQPEFVATLDKVSKWIWTRVASTYVQTISEEQTAVWSV
jgi:hypothetical protein